MSEKEISNPVGRPPKFCPELCDAILKSASDCLPLTLCAEENGIHYDTLREWVNEGLQDILDNKLTEKARFSVAFKKTAADSMRILLERVRGADQGWQGSAWILERRWWKHWSNKAADLDFNERLSKLESEQRKGNSNGEANEIDSKDASTNSKKE